MSQAWLMSAKNAPGWIVLTRMLGPNASANPSVSALSPAFAAAYGSISGRGRIAAMELTLMIEPPPVATIRSPTSAANLHGPFRFRFTTASNNFSFTAVSDS
jgi:hypothetical protein